MNFVRDDNSEDNRKNQETRALQESGAALSRSQFDSMPNPEEFRSRLKNQLLEKRQLKRTSMWEKIKDGLSHIIPTQKTFVMGMVVVLLVALMTTFLLNRPGGIGPKSPLAELLIDKAYARDNFEIIPTSGDGLAVDDTTEFIIKSKTAIDNDILIQNINLEPNAEFTLTPISEHEFRVTPKETLKEKQVYNITIDAAYKDDNNVTVERDFSFAFQVKNTFKVLSTMPGHTMQGAPTNTGIEFTFSSENFSDYEKNFSIEPKVEGRFDVRGRILTFIPKELKPATLYTVTLKKGITVKGSEPMKEDFVFRFETQPKEERGSPSSYWYLYGNKAEFSTAGAHILRIGASNDNEEFTVKAYAFKSFDAYKRNYLKSNAIPSWASETNRQFTVPSADISLAREFSVKTQNHKYDYERYIVFPENLPKGMYWVEISNKDQKNFLFVEVTDIASYLQVTADKTLFWSNSLASKGPLAQTKLSLTSGILLGETNKDGVLTFDTSLLGISTSSDNFVWDQKVVEVTHGNEKALLAFKTNPYRIENAQTDVNEYILNLSSDRSLYLPNDTIQFWGYIAKKDGARVTDTFTVGIPNLNNYFYGRSIGDMGYLESVEVTPDEKGFFRGEMKLSNITPSGYNLVLRKGDIQLQSNYIEINAYVKPSYTLSVKSDKKAVYEGETVNVATKVNFFEGTPVPNYNLTYGTQDTQTGGFVTTDKNGEANFKITAKIHRPCDLMSDSNCFDYEYGRRYQSISINSKDAEESPLQQFVGYMVYESKVDGFVDFDQIDKTQAVVSSTWKNVNLAVLNNDDYTDDEKVLGSVATGKKVEGKILETRSEKKETGEYYDFITKTTQKTYSYEWRTTTTAQFTGTTDARGHFEYKIDTIPDRSYQVIMKVYDDAGNSLIRTSWIYSSSYDEAMDNSIWHSLREKAEQTNPEKITYGYKIGDTVEIEMYKNSSVLKNSTGSILFTQLQDGLKKYAVQKSSLYTFTFGEEHVPNIYIGAVYFDGTKYIQTVESNYRHNIRLDTRDRQLKVDIKTDKSSYKPGETVKVQVKTTDAKTKGHSARVNLSVIDEAFLALRGSNYGEGTKTIAAESPLASLYRNLGDGILLTVYSHENNIGRFGGAEGGGCFLPGTKITLLDGTVKNIEDIQVGDVVQTLKNETDNTLVFGRVTKTQNHIVSEYLILNGKIRVTPEHRILVNGEWKTAGDIIEGDMLRGKNGEPVKVVDIKRHHELVKVYNFEVEGYHTYIAEGIYVHNDKGGAPIRSSFPDVAFYGWVDTDGNGNGTVEFKLPDSVTSWRVTGEAISTNRYGGMGDANVNVSLPVFGVFSVPQDLLIGDNPTLSAVVYGKSLTSQDTVDFTVSGNLFTEALKKQSTAFTRNLFPGNKPAERSGKVKLEMKTSKGSDAIEHSYRAVASRIEQQAQVVLPVQNGPLDLGSARNADSPIELRFTDAGRGSLYNRIYPLTWNGGSRLDQKIGSVVAKDWFHDFFPAEELSQPADLSPYFGNQGFKLLPYGSEDLILSAKAAAVLKDSDAFDKERMNSYFVGQLYNKEANAEEFAVALWGAASLGEPVIPSIHSLAEKPNIEARSKIFLALAATEMGDNEYARTLYEDVLKEKEETDSFAHIDITKDKNQTMENTALMAIVAARLQDPLAEKFDHYVQTEPHVNIYTLEELLFVKEKLENLPAQTAKATLTIANETAKMDLDRGQVAYYTVSPNNFGAISLSDVEGSITLLVNYDTPVTAAQSANKVSVTRKYFVNGKETTSFKEGQRVEVRLYPHIEKDAPAGNYVIVDSIPSGLKLTSPVDRFSPFVYAWCVAGYPFEAEGQSVKFMFDRNFQKATPGYYGSKCEKKDYLSYFTRVSTLGEFKKEPALIQSVESKDVKNFSSDVGVVTISQ